MHHFLPFVLAACVHFGASLSWVRFVLVTIIHVMTPLPRVTGRCSATVSFVRIASCTDVLNPAIFSPVSFLQNVQLLLIRERVKTVLLSLFNNIHSPVLDCILSLRLRMHSLQLLLFLWGVVLLLSTATAPKIASGHVSDFKIIIIPSASLLFQGRRELTIQADL
jgi:hypothetical protein